MKVISIIQYKGGVGKTTTTSSLAVCLATKKNKKVGLIDLDSQSDSSFSIKHKAKPKKDLKQLMEAKKPLKKEDFSPTDYKNLYLIPNNQDVTSTLFAQLEEDLKDRLNILKKLVRNLKGFDYILIDSPPDLDIKTSAIMVASDYIIIPAMYDMFSAKGLVKLSKDIKLAKKINKKLEVLGIFHSRYLWGRKLNKKMEAPLKKYFGDKLFNTKVRENVKFQQAQAEQEDIFSFEKNDFLKKGSKDIEALTDEIINNLNKN